MMFYQHEFVFVRRNTASLLRIVVSNKSHDCDVPETPTGFTLMSVSTGFMYGEAE